MTEFVQVATTKDLPPGERIWIEFEEDTVILFNVDNNYYCIADICSHDGGPLGDGTLYGCEIECPRHGARFDIRTGKVTALPAIDPIASYQVRVENGNVYVESPDAW